MLEKLKPLSGCNGAEGTGDPGNALIAGFMIGSTKGWAVVIGATTATAASLAIAASGCATGGTSGVPATCGLSTGITKAVACY